ncbi:hypothetical protein DL98DRAFT_564276 [Cadophora sp. DSE1049]|nr:hypothetical protein DL98DRAFT_564276 [Cadophora sp. DSE1049]
MCLTTTPRGMARPHIPTFALQECSSLDDFLTQGCVPLTFWFFQTRAAFTSQKRMEKWSRDRLDDYILLPGLKNFVWRKDCFFVSHFWDSANHPDPDGTCLRLHQKELEPQSWAYIWVDWSCMPQEPRSVPEERFFRRSLETISAIIRNCGFTYFYPPFKPRLWILYEIAEYILTCDGGLAVTPDIALFLEHVDEMVATSVQATLEKYNYECSYDGDRNYLTAWLELLVILKRLPMDVDVVRLVMDGITWQVTAHTQTYPLARMEIRKSEGLLVFDGREYNFTPFPQYKDFVRLNE